jgi:hypothetical protein
VIMDALNYGNKYFKADTTVLICVMQIQYTPDFSC